MDDDKDEKLREYRRQYYQKNRGRILARSMEWQRENHEAYTARLRAHRAKDPEADRVRCRKWKDENRDAHNAASREYGRRNAKTISVKLKAKRRVLKQQILDAYGSVCACCGEVQFEFLTLDHIHGDGAAHRKELRMDGGGRSDILYKHLIEAGFPEGYRILCFNCNSALGFYGYCPHNPDSMDGVPVRRRPPTEISASIQLPAAAAPAQLSFLHDPPDVPQADE